MCSARRYACRQGEAAWLLRAMQLETKEPDRAINAILFIANSFVLNGFVINSRNRLNRLLSVCNRIAIIY